MTENKTRKAVTTLVQVSTAYADFLSSLRGQGIDTSGWELVQPVSGGFKILGNVPSNVPSVFPTKEDAYNTFNTWTAIINIIHGMNGEAATPEAVAAVAEATVDESNAPEATPTNTRKRRATSNA